MAAARSSSVRALSKLSTASQVPRHARSLHMTGPAEFSTILTTDKPSASKLKAEVEYAQKQADALEASAYHQQPMRHFNTSRALKTVGDSSTIDFAYFPDFDPDVQAAPALRIPLLPAGLYNTASSYSDEPAEEQVMRPEIVTASADSTHISSPRAFSEVHDNSAVDISEMAQKVASAAGFKTAGSAAQLPDGMTKQLWQGFMDDIFGSKKAN